MEERFETFTVLITKIARSVRRIKNLEMAEYGLRSVHVSCLYYLYAAGGLTATELCERCEEDKGTISRALEHLEASGYLVREERGGKRYKSPLHLTDRGAEAGARIAQKIDTVLLEMDSGLSEGERAEFYRSLGVICARLEAISERLEKTNNGGEYQ